MRNPAAGLILLHLAEVSDLPHHGCVGMFDFQIVEDVNIALEVLGNLKRGLRPWYS